MEEAGFKNSKLEIVHLQSHYTSAEEIVKGFIDGTPLSTYLADREESKRRVVREKFIKAFIDNFGKHNGVVSLQAIVCEGFK